MNDYRSPEEQEASRRRHAELWVMRGERDSAVMIAIAAGHPPAAVAEMLDLTLRSVESVIAEAEYRPWIADLGPSEIVGRAYLSGSDRRQMVEDLCALEYWGDAFMPYPDAVMNAGTWTDLRYACSVYGLISEAEFAEVEARRGPLREQGPIDWYGESK